MEFVLGVLLSWPILIGLVILACIVEYNEGFVFTALLTAIVIGIVYGMFAIPATYLWIGLFSWIPIGFMWSFWRWKKHCNNAVQEAKKYLEDRKDRDADEKYNDKLYAKNTAESKVNVINNVDLIVSWVISWPISFLVSLLDDIIDVLVDMVKVIFRRTYERMSTSALDKVEKL